MFSEEENRAKWILSFLYVKGESKKINEAVYGRTRLMKELFLVDRRIEDKGEETDMEFKPDKFGPSDTNILISLEELRENGFVRSIPEAYVSALSLTGGGLDKAREYLRNFTNITIGSLRRIKRDFNFKTQHDLMKYVYTEFPSYTTKSKIKSRVLGFKNRLLESRSKEIEYDKATFLGDIDDILDMRDPIRELAEDTHIYSISTLKPPNLYRSLELEEFNGSLTETEKSEIKSGYIYHSILYNKPRSLRTRILDRFFDESKVLEISIRPGKDKSTQHKVIQS